MQFVSMGTTAARLLVMLCSALVLTQGHAETITVYGDENHAPLGYLEAGVPKGVLVDMFQQISRITGDTYAIQMYPWARAQKLAREAPGALMNVSMNAQRLEIFDFSEPMYFDDVLVVVLKSKPLKFDKLSDLSGKTLGGNNGGSYGEDIDDAIRNKLFSIEHDNSPTQRLNKLLAGGRMDAALIPGGRLGFEAALAADPELLKVRDKFQVLAKPFVRDPLYLAVHKSLRMDALLARFNAALKTLKK